MNLLDFTDTIGLTVETIHVPNAYSLWVSRLTKGKAEIFFAGNDKEVISPSIYGTGMTPDESIKELCNEINRFKSIFINGDRAHQYRITSTLEY